MERPTGARSPVPKFNGVRSPGTRYENRPSVLNYDDRISCDEIAETYMVSVIYYLLVAA